MVCACAALRCAVLCPCSRPSPRGGRPCASSRAHPTSPTRYPTTGSNQGYAKGTGRLSPSPHPTPHSATRHPTPRPSQRNPQGPGTRPSTRDPCHPSANTPTSSTRHPSANTPTSRHATTAHTPTSGSTHAGASRRSSSRPCTRRTDRHQPAHHRKPWRHFRPQAAAGSSSSSPRQ